MTITDDPYNTNLDFGNKLKLNQKQKKEKRDKDNDIGGDVLELPDDGREEPHAWPITPTFELPGAGGTTPPTKPIKP
jgi:hypothetical protein